MERNPWELPPNYTPPQSAEELLARYAAGERFFDGANLGGADLARANLAVARLCGANLRAADLDGANLAGASLRGANLRAADLRAANLARASLARANLADTDLGGTYLLEVDLSAFCDADPPVRHWSPSTVDYLSIIRSVRSPRLKEFLIRTGMPVMFAEYNVDCAVAASGSGFDMMRSTFISYGGPDNAFARKLYEALHSNGVTTFLYEEHAIPGEKIHRTMRKGVNEHDRVVLICSKASLVRPGVLAEIEHVLEREARDGGETYLIPIRLDDYVLRDWAPKREDLAQAVRDREVANFEGADTDPVKFEKALGRLLRALRKPTLPKPDP